MKPCRFVVALSLTMLDCSNYQPSAHTSVPLTDKGGPEAPEVAASAVTARIPCPIKIISVRMVHNLEEDVYATIKNTSASDITAIAFGAPHADKFGTIRTPYKTDLTSEDTIKRGHSQSMHWEVLMDEVFTTGAKPGNVQFYVTKVAFADGRVLDTLGIDGNCGVNF